MWKELIQEKGTQSTQLSVQSLQIKFVLFKCHRSLIFIFLSCREKAHDIKEFSRENSNPRHESRITIR